MRRDGRGDGCDQTPVWNGIGGRIPLQTAHMLLICIRSIAPVVNLVYQSFIAHMQAVRTRGIAEKSRRRRRHRRTPSHQPLIATRQASI
eukprot:6206180-Pleurochrysis_carterae.AAC.5